MEVLKQQVAQLIEQEPKLLPAAIAERLNISEFEAVSALPDEMVALTAALSRQLDASPSILWVDTERQRIDQEALSALPSQHMCRPCRGLQVAASAPSANSFLGGGA